MNNEELLQKILKEQKKSTLGSRITAIACVVIAVAVIAAAAILIPRTIKVSADIQGTIEQVNEAVEEARSLISNTDELVADNTEAVTVTLDKLKEIDIDSLNTAIKNLSDTIEPLANFVRLFK